MSKTYKIIYYILLTAILAWLLPWFYTATLKERTPFTLYSEIIEDFAMINVNQNEKIYVTPTEKETFTPKGNSTAFCLCFITGNLLPITGYLTPYEVFPLQRAK